MAPALRGLTDDEAALLVHVSRWGSDGYPVRKVTVNGRTRGWTWDFRSVKAPTNYPTKRAAVAAVEGFLGVLRDAKAGRV